MSSVEERVTKIVVEQLGASEDQVKPEASFVDDLGADSLDTVELVMALEEEFECEIPDEEAENITTVQFDHRLLATVLFLLIPTLWLIARRANLPTRTRWGLHILLIILGIQITLGISTLLLYVPVPLAAAHQAGALALFTAALFVSHELYVS